MLLLWLCGSALMTLRVGAKSQQAGPSPVRTPGEPGLMNSVDPLDRDGEEPFAGPLSQPQVMSESQAAGGVSSLGLSRGQRPMEYAGPEMAFFAASADS